MPLPYLACMVFAARVYHLPPRILPSIMAVEGGVLGVPHVNTDGSEDLGPMQVNSRWLPALARAARQPVPVVRARLLYQPCFDIVAAGAILRLYVTEARGNWMQAIGFYHSHTATLSLDYQRKVVAAARRMFAQRWNPGVSDGG